MISNSDIHIAEKSGLSGIYWTKHSENSWTDGLSCPSGEGIKINDNNEAVVKDEEGNEWKIVIISFDNKLKAIMKNSVCYNDLAKVINKSSHWRTDWNVLRLLSGFHDGDTIAVNLNPKYFGLIPADKNLKEVEAYEDIDGMYHDWWLIAR